MAIKRRRKVSAEFSMASMTDMIFLLLIFFMIAATQIVPNSIKVVLPQSMQKNDVKPISRITIDNQLNYYVAFGKEKERQIGFDDIASFLQSSYDRDQEMYVALYADQTIPYGEVVKIMDIANQHNFKMVLVTRPK